MPLPTYKPFPLLSKLEIIGVILKMIPYGAAFKQLTSVTNGGFADRFQSPLIAASLRQLIFCENAVLMSIASTLGMLGTGGSAAPKGGSLAFTRAIERRYAELGGELRLNSAVRRVVVENGRAVGVELADGSVERADWVVAACDLGLTLDRLLEGRFESPAHRALLAPATEKYRSAVQVSFGIRGRLEWPTECLFQNLHLTEPIACPGGSTDRLVVKDYGPDPTMAPAGKSVVTVLTMVDDPRPWLDLAGDRAAYQSAKAGFAEAVAAALERFHPGFRARIEMTDVATPHTYRRYTGTHEGRFMSYVMSPANQNQMQSIPLAVPGLAGLYLAGMWLISPGGVPGAAKTARDAIQYICREDGRRFTATRPDR
jgi:phytoene dehydrogenase-like protein